MPVTVQNQLDRRDAIRRLLESGPVANQQWLVDALSEQGLEATQSSVSRDLRELGAVKTASGYELLADAAVASRGIDEVAAMIRAARPAGAHLLVITTAVGAAQRVALELDRSGWPEIVGTVAGDDTIFVATSSADRQRVLRSRLDSEAGRA